MQEHSMDLKSGKPPHVGWWLCSGNWWRWWNGEYWSYGAKAFASESAVYKAARKKALSDEIDWCEFWPDNAIVKRIDPSHFQAKAARPKHRGNRRVTRYLVVDDNLTYGAREVACLDSREEARAFISHRRKVTKEARLRIKPLRFRTPEASKSIKEIK